MMAPILQVNNLRLSFRTNNGTVKAVRDISFTLGKGETLAIVGESGSGKSVTARAIMGILAPNAIVDNGEIIYDGRDLLRISEEDFHQLRGDKLSMIFQDPLSSLNPIVRIGKQLTEAMLLNNRERRRNAGKRLNEMFALLSHNINRAKGNSAEVHSETSNKIKVFRAFTNHGIELEGAYDAAHETIVEAISDIEDLLIELIQGDTALNAKEALRVSKVLEGCYNPYLIIKEHSELPMLQAKLREEAALYKSSKKPEALKAVLEEIQPILEAELKKTRPNFFCIGYYELHGHAVPANPDIEALNADARKTLDDEFMLDFINDVALGVGYATRESLAKKEAAVDALKRGLAVYQKETLDAGECRSTASKLSAMVNAAINPLAIQKNNFEYVFSSSLQIAVQRYFDGVTKNPREQARYEKQSKRYEELMAKGKDASKVVPPVIIDLEAAQQNMQKTVSNVLTSYAKELEQGSNIDFNQRAVDIIDYLKLQASQCAIKLTQSGAKHHALELMSEVGISEPRKRYRQFPFQFSGGMRQRIVIAIALSANPDILICDEPTTALDVTIQSQILELINKLKVERGLSIIFITHDLGVVANMADRIAVMYAGKIVEYGTADDIFYQPSHPYTWALLSSMPDLETTEKLAAIPGTPPNMIIPPVGDAFAARNQYALQIDFEQQPPFFKISDTHYAATWLLHKDAPKVTPPAIVTERIERMKRLEASQHEQ